MKLFGNKIGRSNTKPEKIHDLVNELRNRNGKACNLDIGGEGKNDKLTTINIKSGADYVGDIRPLFVPNYPSELTKDMDALPYGHFKFVQMVHTCEHVEWIYQKQMLDWVYALLSEGGFFFLSTPNLEYVAKMYVKNLELWDKSKPLKYPANEYADGKQLSEGKREDLCRWVNFKLMSGCSPGDYHLCVYDSFTLHRVLSDVGFIDFKISSTQTIELLCRKPIVNSAIATVDDLVEEVTDDN